MEWAQWNVRVNMLSPGPFMSEMMEGGAKTQPGFLELVAGGTFLKRIADPQEIVGPVCYLVERRVVVRDRRRSLRLRRDDEVSDATTVIDVDAHFEPAADWLDDFPALKAELPELLPDTDPRFRMDSGEMFAYFVSDDLLRNVPREQRMPIDRLTTPVMQVMFDPNRPEGVGYPGSDQFKPMTDPAGARPRVDGRGGDRGPARDLRRRLHARTRHRRSCARSPALEAVNTWMTDAAADYLDRLRPVTSLRFDDLDWVVAELTRMRERGSRAFLVSAEPAGGIPPMHPDFDKVWAAATDLGMIAHLHVGMNPGLSIQPRGANTDDPAIIRLISLQNPHHSAQVFLTAVVFGGVFERHPNLTVLVSELGIDWFPGWVNKVDRWRRQG